MEEAPPIKYSVVLKRQHFCHGKEDVVVHHAITIWIRYHAQRKQHKETIRACLMPVRRLYEFLRVKMGTLELRPNLQCPTRKSPFTMVHY
eukprot:scaffold1680_cov139-Skeletonema_menzelii.AAC.6